MNKKKLRKKIMKPKKIKWEHKPVIDQWKDKRLQKKFIKKGWTVKVQLKKMAIMKVYGASQTLNTLKFYPNADPFFHSLEWQRLRIEVFSKYPHMCMRCKSRKKLQIDHIKPRSKFPDLAFDVNNLQILCEPCNLGKSNIDLTDWRETWG